MFKLGIVVDLKDCASPDQLLEMEREKENGRMGICNAFILVLDSLLFGTGIDVLAPTKFRAAISVTETLSLAILLKGSTTTLPGSCRRDLFKIQLALTRSWSHLGSGDGSLSLSLNGGGGTGGGRDCDSWASGRGEDKLSVGPDVTESSLGIPGAESMTG